MALATLTELKTYLGTESAAQDAALSAALDYAGGFLSGTTGRVLEEAEHVEIHSARAGRVFLREWPVREILSLHVDASGLFGSGTEKDSSGWILAPGGVLSLREEAFPQAPGSVRVSYRAGFEENAVPPDLKMACLMLAAHVFRQRRGIGVDTRALGEGQMRHRHAMPDEVERVAVFYRRRDF